MLSGEIIIARAWRRVRIEKGISIALVVAAAVALSALVVSSVYHTALIYFP